MNDWSSGYVSDVGYTYGYYNELNPLRIKLAFLNQGLVFPKFETACELGYGQGISANIHAAASGTKWWGTDFNPSQASFAKEVAEISGSGAKLFDDSFKEFLVRTDLPDFDFIALHGIWSWISDENRRAVTDFISKKLKVGGVLYISYNSHPGWAQFAPIRHLLSQHSDIIGSRGVGTVNRVNEALSFLEEFVSLNPLICRASPLMAERSLKLKEQNKHYLAHEYFNKDWAPMYFSEVAKWMEPTKAKFACSANFLEHINAINFTPEQEALLNRYQQFEFRETIRDFLVNQQFRRDYWVKGLRTLTDIEQKEQIRKIKVILVASPDHITMKVNGSLGEADLNKSVYEPILQSLSTLEPKTISQIEEDLSESQITFPQILQAIMILAGKNCICEIQSDDAIERSVEKSDRLNNYIISKAKGSDEISYLASPVTGGGITVTRFQQLMILAIKNGKTEVKEIAEFVWRILESQGQKLIKDQSVIDSEQGNVEELIALTEAFKAKDLQIFQALKMV